MPVPTVRLAALVAVLTAAVVAFPAGAGAGLLWVNAVVAVVVVGDWTLAVRPSDLHVERKLPASVRAGSPADVNWVVANASSRRAYLVLSDDFPPSLRAVRRGTRLMIGAGESVTAKVLIRPERRGRFELRGIAVRSFGPLGLAGRQRFLADREDLRVTPAFPSERDATARAARLRMVEAGVRPVRMTGGSREFDALREYTPDDEFRRIDWAATARVRKPIVRTYRSERNQLVVLLVDSGRLMAGSVAGAPRLDHTVDAALAVTTVATAIGDRVGLVAFDDRVRRLVPASSARRQLSRVTEALYDVDATLVETDFRGAIAQTLARFPRRALVVMLTELPSTAASDLLAAAVPRMARHHLPVVASVRDPQLSEWAHSQPTKASDAYLAAAAAGTLEDRDRLGSRLRALGATVVDTTPGQLASSLVDVYVKVKATGRL